MARSIPPAALICGVLWASLHGQTTQGVISGRLLNSVTGAPIQGATISYTCAVSTCQGSTPSGEEGYYILPLLSPGTYRVRVTGDGYQSREVQNLELTVAARIDLQFRLRPISDVWESGQYKSVFLPGSKTIVTFFGPDVDPSRSGSFEASKARAESLESAVSEVIGPLEINELPLGGRDVYTMLVTLPGVTSDAATARGLGLSVNGQRPSASNFLLDGLENNNYLITEPLAVVAPEAIQEYRVSTNNFSAEYGRTAGFLANAITRSGTNEFHGVGYLYLKNEALNANGFQENLQGDPRGPFKQAQPGFFVGGPVLRNRLFFSGALEFLHSGSQQDPQTFMVPATPGIFDFAIEGRQSRTLLQKYSPPAGTGNGITGEVTLAPPVTINRTISLSRLDYAAPNGRDRVMGELIVSRLNRPDFIWTPYPDFVSALHQNTWKAALAQTRILRPNLTNEARAGYSNDDLHWNRPHPEIPTFTSADGTVLPGSPAFYAYKNVNGSWEVLDNLIWARGPHVITMGAGALFRSSDGYLTAGRDGQYLFTNIVTFAQDRPSFLRASVDRTDLPAIVQPDYDRTYRYRQYYAFVQDTFRLSRHVTVNFGLRYELFGAPSNVGDAKETLVKLGSGSTLADQLKGASLAPGGSQDQQLFGTDQKDVAVRAGMAYDLWGNGKTLLRGAYGVFYDRPFDNLWENMRNNSLIVPLLTLAAPQTNFTGPLQNTLNLFAGQTLSGNFPSLTLVDPNLRNGYVHSYFAGVQQHLSEGVTLEVNALGSYGRRLITTDIVNRDFSTSGGRYNPALPDISYRSGQGFSDYNALTALIRYHFTRGILQCAYTLSHAIDNQSEPLLGDFFNLTFTGIQANTGSIGKAAFSRQFDPESDRGNADFDQRHNLVFLYVWNLPAPAMKSRAGFLFRDWAVSGLTAFRSGFPYTVVGPSSTISGEGQILNGRPDLLTSTGAVLAQPVAVAGGQRLLNAAAFASPPASQLGSLGRNSLTGPGFYNVDFSLARSFAVKWLGESGRLNVRANAFNILNHANLNNPDTLLTSPTFGIAQYGRQGQLSGFPAVSPLNEMPRQIQLSVRVEF